MAMRRSCTIVPRSAISRRCPVPVRARRREAIERVGKPLHRSPSWIDLDREVRVLRAAQSRLAVATHGPRIATPNDAIGVAKWGAAPAAMCRGVGVSNNGWCGSIVKNFGVLGLAAVLAVGLAACAERLGDAPKLTLEPGGGFKAEVQAGVKTSLKIPDRVSSDAALIEGDLTLENNAGDIVIVSVPRPCDIYDWVIRDAGGKVVMARGQIECVDQPATKSLAPGALSERISIYLMPRVLNGGQRYVVDYRFWGQPARAEFTAR